MNRREALIRQENKRLQHAQFVRDEKRRSLGRIADTFPRLCSVQLHLSFSDPDGVIPPQVSDLVRGPGDPACFDLGCLSHECVGGGFDLTPKIVEMVGRKDGQTSGSLKCEGWQDAERILRHRCWCQLDYKISCSYSG